MVCIIPQERSRLGRDALYAICASLIEKHLHVLKDSRMHNARACIGRVGASIIQRRLFEGLSPEVSGLSLLPPTLSRPVTRLFAEPLASGT